MAALTGWRIANELAKRIDIDKATIARYEKNAGGRSTSEGATEARARNRDGDDGDTVVEDAEGGIDKVIATISYTLGGAIERLSPSGAGALTGTGNDLDNVILGSDGRDSLQGSEGNNTLGGGKHEAVYRRGAPGARGQLQTSLTRSWHGATTPPPVSPLLSLKEYQYRTTPDWEIAEGAAMDRLRIVGGRRLQGAVAIAGAKNAALPQIAAALLSDRPLTLTNVPQVTDIDTMLALVGQYGLAPLRREGARLTLDAAAARPGEASYDLVRKMRASVLVLGPLVARFGAARVSLPGGCAIGARPIDLHLKALTTLGAVVDVVGGYIEARAPSGLKGARIVLASPSVGATTTALLAATGARGETEIFNAARDPEVQDLADCLVAMGARIEGAGAHRLVVAGPTTWRDASHAIIADRIEAGTYAIAAAITGGEIELSNTRLEHLAVVGQVLEATGVTLWPTDRGLMAGRSGRLGAADVTTEPYPGFPTDLQAQFMALMTVADGASAIRETVFESRFMHVPELVRLGAQITLNGTTAVVRGGATLHGAAVMATDLRASVSLVIAALAAEGETIVNRVYHLDRGYEALDRKLARCGAAIERLRD